MRHPAQLLVCHERIEAPSFMRRVLRARQGEPARQFCTLSAYAWCYSCGYYVCDVHVESRHSMHATDVEFPEKRTEADI